MSKTIWTSEEDAILYENYNTVGIRGLPVLLPNKTRSQIHTRIGYLGDVASPNPVCGTYNRKKRGGWPKAFNDEFFSVVAPKPAFRAGFIAADGTVSGNRIRVKISDRDEDYLVEFAKDVGYKNKFYRTPPTPTNIKGFETVRRGTVSMNLRGEKAVEDLRIRYNITERKSLRLQPPENIGLESSVAFSAGYIDGDGSISYVTGAHDRGNGVPCSITVYGTENMLKWIMDVVSRSGVLTSSTVRPCKTSRCFHTSITGQKAREFAGIVDSLHLPLMSRKWDKILNKKCVGG